MVLDDLTAVIEKLQYMIDTHNDYLSSTKEQERRTRQVLIDPLLRVLGWDVSDPNMVQIEYEVEGKRADYALMADGQPVALIEAKALGKSLEPGEVFKKAGAPYLIVTDGDRWEMFEVLKKTALKERMEFQLSEHAAHEIIKAVIEIWSPHLASNTAMKPVVRITPPTRLSVTMSDGERSDEVNEKDGSMTFVKVIEWIGIQRVKNLNKLVGSYPLISTSDNDSYSYHQLGPNYIITGIPTEKKKEILEKIASDLDDVNLKVEIIPK